MIVRTKKYKLDTKVYIRTGLRNILKEQWWVFLIAAMIASGAFFIYSIWWIIGALIGLGLFWLFWYIQFVGVTQLEQGKMLFERMSYEISSQQIMIKLNSKQGMPIKWDQIKRARIGKDNFVLVMSKAQFIFLPFKIFNTEHERKFLESVLKRKKYIS